MPEEAVHVQQEIDDKTRLYIRNIKLLLEQMEDQLDNLQYILDFGLAPKVHFPALGDFFQKGEKGEKFPSYRDRIL